MSDRRAGAGEKKPDDQLHVMKLHDLIITELFNITDVEALKKILDLIKQLALEKEEEE